MINDRLTLKHELIYNTMLAIVIAAQFTGGSLTDKKWVKFLRTGVFRTKVFWNYGRFVLVVGI